MRVGLYRKRFEATLIDRPGPRRVMVRMPSLGMGDGHPPQHLRQLAITSRPEQEVPVIRHQAIGGNANPRLGLGLSQDRFKRGIISGLVKQREPPDTTVQNMIREVFRSKAKAARHAKLLPTRPPSVKKRLPTPFIVLADPNGWLARILGHGSCRLQAQSANRRRA